MRDAAWDSVLVLIGRAAPSRRDYYGYQRHFETQAAWRYPVGNTMKSIIVITTVLGIAGLVQAQTAEQRVCDAVKDPYSPQCVLINGMPKTSPSMPQPHLPIVPTMEDPWKVVSIGATPVSPTPRVGTPPPIVPLGGNAPVAPAPQPVTVPAWTPSHSTVQQSSGDFSTALGYALGQALARRREARQAKKEAEEQPLPSTTMPSVEEQLAIEQKKITEYEALRKRAEVEGWEAVYEAEKKKAAESK